MIRPTGGAVSAHSRTYHFIIDAWEASRLPMARLAEYMTDLAGLFGHTESVHFDRLEAGSTVLVQHVERHADAGVRERLDAAQRHDVPDEIAKPVADIDQKLAADMATGSLQEAGGAEILRFPGRERPEMASFGPFRQDGTLDGVLIRVGGKDETVPVHLDDHGTIHRCNATREIARQLAPHLFGGPLRVHGNGRWERQHPGNWVLLRFDIRHFEPLDDKPLTEVVEQLQQTEGSGWRDISDPAAVLRRLREGAGDTS